MLDPLKNVKWKSRREICSFCKTGLSYGRWQASANFRRKCSASSRPKDEKVVSKAARFEPTSSARNEGRKSLRRQLRLGGENGKNRREPAHKKTSTTLRLATSLNSYKTAGSAG